MWLLKDRMNANDKERKERFLFIGSQFPIFLQGPARQYISGHGASIAMGVVSHGGAILMV